MIWPLKRLRIVRIDPAAEDEPSWWLAIEVEIREIGRKPRAEVWRGAPLGEWVSRQVKGQPDPRLRRRLDRAYLGRMKAVARRRW